eukprot:scpid107650/ scgid16821/ 
MGPAHSSCVLRCSAARETCRPVPVLLAPAAHAINPPAPANLVPVRRRGDVVPTVILAGVGSAPISVILTCRTQLLMLVVMLLAQVQCQMFRLVGCLAVAWHGMHQVPGLSLPVMAHQEILRCL